MSEVTVTSCSFTLNVQCVRLAALKCVVTLTEVVKEQLLLDIFVYVQNCRNRSRCCEMLTVECVQAVIRSARATLVSMAASVLSGTRGTSAIVPIHHSADGIVDEVSSLESF